MEKDITDLSRQILELEKQLEERLEAKRLEFSYRLEEGRVQFEKEVVARHRELKTGVLSFLRHSRFAVALTSPFVYSLMAPLMALDLLTTLYQWICYPIYNIKKVPRSSFIVVDRYNLAYLNGIEKLNCAYCGYATGVIAYTREVAARTEEYWCPIKHARRLQNAHSKYMEFVDFGDADSYRKRRNHTQGTWRGK